MHATACNFLHRRARIRSYKSSSCRKIKLTPLRARRKQPKQENSRWEKEFLLLRLSGFRRRMPFRDFRGRAAQFATTSPVLLQSYTRCEG